VSTVTPRAVLLAASVVVAVVVVWSQAGDAAHPTIDQQAHSIAAGLRCPVCRDLSVAESPSGLAQRMRGTIVHGLRAGESPDQIRAGFVRAYGEWVLLEPPKRGLTLLAWVVPLVALIVGVAGAALLVARRADVAGPVPEREVPA
jgi:cytochrome c-type biogenesis protein CcmH